MLEALKAKLFSNPHQNQIHVKGYDDHIAVFSKRLYLLNFQNEEQASNLGGNFSPRARKTQLDLFSKFSKQEKDQIKHEIIETYCKDFANEVLLLDLQSNPSFIDEKGHDSGHEENFKGTLDEKTSRLLAVNSIINFIFTGKLKISTNNYLELQKIIKKYYKNMNHLIAGLHHFENTFGKPEETGIVSGTKTSSKIKLETSFDQNSEEEDEIDDHDHSCFVYYFIDHSHFPRLFNAWKGKENKFTTLCLMFNLDESEIEIEKRILSFEGMPLEVKQFLSTGHAYFNNLGDLERAFIWVKDNNFPSIELALTKHLCSLMCSKIKPSKSIVSTCCHYYAIGNDLLQQQAKSYIILYLYQILENFRDHFLNSVEPKFFIDCLSDNNIDPVFPVEPVQ